MVLLELDEITLVPGPEAWKGFAAALALGYRELNRCLVFRRGLDRARARALLDEVLGSQDEYRAEPSPFEFESAAVDVSRPPPERFLDVTPLVRAPDVGTRAALAALGV